MFPTILILTNVMMRILFFSIKLICVLTVVVLAVVFQLVTVILNGILHNEHAAVTPPDTYNLHI